MKSLKNTQTTLIQKQSMREQILSVLRTSILNHTYPMGSRLNLDELRRDLGVSNTPLREAISILEGEGLVGVFSWLHHLKKHITISHNMFCF